MGPSRVRQHAAESTEMQTTRQQSPDAEWKFLPFQYSKYGYICPAPQARRSVSQTVQHGFRSGKSGGLIDVKYLFHFGPPFSFFAGIERLLHRHHDRPPFLRSRIGGHLSHVRLIVGPVILKISEQKIVLEINGIVSNVALSNRFENVGPYGRMIPLVFSDRFRSYLND